jgi:hypothetical protein
LALEVNVDRVKLLVALDQRAKGTTRNETRVGKPCVSRSCTSPSFGERQRMPEADEGLPLEGREGPQLGKNHV